jgi:hypothetical protein
MGNIHREVFPIKRRSFCDKLARAVKMISMHHPVRPQIKKSFHFIFIPLYLI